MAVGRAHDAHARRAPVPGRGPARGDEPRGTDTIDAGRRAVDHEPRAEPRARRQRGAARKCRAGLRLSLAAAVRDRRLRGLALREPEPRSGPRDGAVVGRRAAPARGGLGVRRRRVPHRVRGLHRPRLLRADGWLPVGARQDLREHRRVQRPGPGTLHRARRGRSALAPVREPHLDEAREPLRELRDRGLGNPEPERHARPDLGAAVRHSHGRMARPRAARRERLETRGTLERRAVDAR